MIAGHTVCLGHSPLTDCNYQTKHCQKAKSQRGHSLTLSIRLQEVSATISQHVAHEACSLYTGWRIPCNRLNFYILQNLWEQAWRRLLCLLPPWWCRNTVSHAVSVCPLQLINAACSLLIHRMFLFWNSLQGFTCLYHFSFCFTCVCSANYYYLWNQPGFTFR